MNSDLKFMWHFPKQNEKLNYQKTQMQPNQSPKTVRSNLPNMISNRAYLPESEEDFLAVGNVSMLRQGLTVNLTIANLRIVRLRYYLIRSQKPDQV